jgi:hypothetical protein
MELYRVITEGGEHITLTSRELSFIEKYHSATPEKKRIAETILKPKVQRLRDRK